MTNNTTNIKLSRTATTKATRQEALTDLNNYNFHKGEMVIATYYSSPTNINALFVVGIGEGKGKYKVVSLLQNRVVKGILYSEPRDKTGYLWTNGENWYLENDPLSLYPGIIINDISSQTFYAVSEDDFIPRQINDVYNREELLEKTSDIISKISQSDWDDDNVLSPSYIYNKPEDLSGFGEDIYYTLGQVPGVDSRFVYYALRKAIGTSTPVSVGDIIQVPFDSFLESGSVEVVQEEDKQPGGKFYEEPDFLVGDKYLDLVVRIGSGLTNHIYILVKALTESLEPGNRILIENNQISLDILEQGGLGFNEEGALTVSPATNSSFGSMTPEMKQKLDSIHEEDYVLISDIEDGSIEPRVSKASQDIDAPPSDFRINETPGYYRRPSGGDNSVETGIAEILYIKGGEVEYDNQEKPVYCYPKFISTGNNSWRPTQTIQDTKINSDGTTSSDTNYSIAYLPCFSTPYSIIGENFLVGFSTNYPSTSFLVLEADEHNHYNPPQSGYLYISTENDNLSGLCVRISGDGAKDDVYEEYTELILDLGDWENKPEYVSNYLLYQKKNNNELSDSIVNVDGDLFCNKKWGVREFAINEWGNIQSETITVDGIQVIQYYYQFEFQTTDPERVKPGTEFIIVDEKFTYDLDNTTFWKKSLQDIRVLENSSGFRYYVSRSDNTLKELRINYELDEPLTIDTGVNASYTVYEYGTECFDSSVLPVSISTRYKPNLLNDLVRIESGLRKKVNRAEVDDQISDSSKNMVQNKVVKAYIDRMVSSFSTGEVGDLSKQSPLGEPRLMNTANCYIITKHTSSDSGVYRFPLVYGNGIKNGENNTRAYTNFVNHLDNTITSPYLEENSGVDINSCGILWSDSGSTVSSPSIITSNGYKYISFSATPGDGNTVIYVKDSQNRIVWTWHIWEINPSSIPLTRILSPVSIWNSIPADGPTGGTEYKIMPVYLGFTGNGTNGIYYQWGRKDPFSVSAFTPTYSTTKASTANSIQNPQTLYEPTNTSWNTANISNYWDYNNPAPKTFGDYNTGKTIYDPCPAGWKVPNSNIFRGFTITGRNSSNSGEWNIKGTYRPGNSTPGTSGYDLKHTYEDNQPSLSYPLFQALGYINDEGLKQNQEQGYFWTAIYECSLGFTSSEINPISNELFDMMALPIQPILE